MIIGSRQRISKNVFLSTSWLIGFDKIKRVTTTKTLGVIVDENISRKNPIDNICNTVSKRIGKLRKTKAVISTESLKRLYDTLVSPHFYYL